MESFGPAIVLVCCPAVKKPWKPLSTKGKLSASYMNSTQMATKEVDKLLKYGLIERKHFHFLITSGEIAKKVFRQGNYPFRHPEKNTGSWEKSILSIHLMHRCFKIRPILKQPLFKKPISSIFLSLTSTARIRRIPLCSKKKSENSPYLACRWSALIPIDLPTKGILPVLSSDKAALLRSMKS